MLMVCDHDLSSWDQCQGVSREDPQYPHNLAWLRPSKMNRDPPIARVVRLERPNINVWKAQENPDILHAISLYDVVKWREMTAIVGVRVDICSLTEEIYNLCIRRFRRIGQRRPPQDIGHIGIDLRATQQKLCYCGMPHLYDGMEECPPIGGNIIDIEQSLTRQAYLIHCYPQPLDHVQTAILNA